jgi:hypothetical protein
LSKGLDEPVLIVLYINRTARIKTGSAGRRNAGIGGAMKWITREKVKVDRCTMVCKSLIVVVVFILNTASAVAQKHLGEPFDLGVGESVLIVDAGIRVGASSPATRTAASTVSSTAAKGKTSTGRSRRHSPRAGAKIERRA